MDNPRDLSAEEVVDEQAVEAEAVQAQAEVARLSHMRDVFSTPGWQYIVEELVHERDRALTSLLAGEDVDVAKVARAKGQIAALGVMLGLPMKVETDIRLAENTLRDTQQEGDDD